MNPFAIIPLWARLAAVAALVLAVFGYGWLKGAQSGERKFDKYVLAQNAAVLAQVNKAAGVAANLRSDAAVLETVKNEQIAAVNLRLSRALSELRNRPERRPVDPGHPAACAGANGRELSMPDGSFLAGIAANAGRLQVERNECIAKYNSVRDALNKMKDDAAARRSSEDPNGN